MPVAAPSVALIWPTSAAVSPVLSDLSAMEASCQPSLKLKAKSLLARTLNVVSRYGRFGFGRYKGVTL